MPSHYFRTSPPSCALASLQFTPYNGSLYLTHADAQGTPRGVLASFVGLNLLVVVRVSSTVCLLLRVQMETQGVSGTFP